MISIPKRCSCGKEFVAHTNRQKWCKECGRMHQLTRQRRYMRDYRKGKIQPKTRKPEHTSDPNLIDGWLYHSW